MSKYKGKRVLIVGFGRSGVAVAKYMVRQGAKVTVTDLKQKNELTESVNACADLKIEYELGKHNNKTFHTAELIVVSPGVPLNIKPLEEARAKQNPHHQRSRPCCRGVQGAGHRDHRHQRQDDHHHPDRRDVQGRPEARLRRRQHRQPASQLRPGGEGEGEAGGPIVAELSSFQLELTEKLTPAVAVFTNIEEDHLDRYPDFASYVAAKKRLLKACDRNSFVVVNHDCQNISRFAEENTGKLIWFTKRDPIRIGGSFAENFAGAYYNGTTKQVVSKINGREEFYDLKQFRLFGEHNRENLMAAIIAARTMGISQKAIQTVIETFKGVAHRLEYIRKKDGVYFFNDSKGTNVMSVQRSLAAFNSNSIILIAGGKDKNMDFMPLVNLVKTKCKILILLGEAKEKINRAIGDYAETYLVGTFDEAVLLAYQKSRSGDIILLSPGCASYDMFRNFEERGEYFKKLVNQL